MNFKKVAEQAERLVLKTGDFIHRESEIFDQRKVEKKGFNDLVSYVDKSAEQMLVDGLRKILPEAGFIAEEGTASNNSEDLLWIIDPLDGTTNFTHGLPVFSISVALMHLNELVLGIVYEVNRKEMFMAIRGEGATCNGRRIRVSPKTDLQDSLIATGFPYYDFNRTDTYLEILKSFMQGTHGVRRLGSAAVDLAYVACGRFEGFYEYNLNAWDVAAGILLVQEAGGVVSDFSGGDDYLFGREIIAACRVHGAMQSIIADQWFD